MWRPWSRRARAGGWSRSGCWPWRRVARPASAPACRRRRRAASGSEPGVVLGSGIGGLGRIAEAVVVPGAGRAAARVAVFHSGAVDQRGGAGPCHAGVTACASGANATGDATRSSQLGHADARLAGGTEAATGRLALAGFAAMRAMSSGFNATPEHASRPRGQAARRLRARRRRERGGALCLDPLAGGPGAAADAEPARARSGGRARLGAAGRAARPPRSRALELLRVRGGAQREPGFRAPAATTDAARSW